MSGSPTGAPAITVVVATRERGEPCRRLCASVEQQFAAHPVIRGEVLLVFDGCEPYDWYRPGGTIRHVHLTSRAGIAGARNAGIMAASGDVVAFLDDDCVPASGWLAAVLRALDAYPHAVAFGGRVIGTDTVNLYSQLRREVYYREAFGAWYVDPAVPGDRRGAPYVNGGNSAYRREAILAVGGFDCVLPAYSDVELGRRLGLDRHGMLVGGMDILHDHPSMLRSYLLRCYRSGRARGLMWARCRYRQEAPGAALGAVVANIGWKNPMRRARRVKAPWTRTVSVLFCQEVIHAIGYAVSIVKAGAARGDGSRGRPRRATGPRSDPGRPQPPVAPPPAVDGQ